MGSATPDNAAGSDLDAVDGHSITMMIGQLRSDNRREFDDAAAAIWSRYFGDLLQLARRNLSPALRQREDEHDLLQSMYNSFCVRQREGQYELPSREDLWNLLSQIVRNKAKNVAARHGRKSRDYRRETKPSAKAESDAGPLDVTPAAVPSALDELVFGEALEQIKALDESLQKLALWKLAGFTNEDIASEKMMNCAVRTVERKLKRIRDLWEHGEGNKGESAEESA
jgi:hypothetical protein